MLRDAGDITLEMSPSSRKRQEGWVFSQAYNSYKEVFNAAKTKPFGNPYLCQLTWDCNVAKMIEKQGRAVLVSDPRLRKSYQASKKRLFTSLAEGSMLSYGVREEHRISLAFFDRVRISLEATGNWDVPLTLTADNLQHIWHLSTTDYLGYLGHNANKFMAAFEWILTLGKKNRVSYEHCKVMTMLLQALPFAFDSGPIIRQSELWKEQFQRRKGGPYVLGMGLERTLPDYGYMWFLPRINWEEMVFRTHIAEKMAFNYSMLRENYRKNGLQVKDAKDDYARVEAAGQWLRCYGSNQACRDIIFGFLIQLVMRAYRKEVYGHFKSQFREGLYPEAATGEIPLCATELQRLLTDEFMQNLCIVNGDRTKIQTIEALVSLLWDFNDQVKRGHWENIAFRTIFQRAVELIGEYCGVENQSMFHDTVKRYFIATNWLIPYPRNNKFFQKNQHKETMWIAVYHRRLAYSETKRQCRLPLSFLLNTIKSTPTRYRPRSAPWVMPERIRRTKDWNAWDRWAPARFQYMRDWDLSNGETHSIMTQVPVEEIEDFYRPDATLESVRNVLEREWQVEQGLVED